MRKAFGLATIALAFILFSACQAAPTPTSVPTETPVPTETAVPTETKVPSATPLPSRTPFPTPAEAAPERTFARIGAAATLSGSHGISGTAIVAGRQTLIIQTFSFDGKGPQADVRLVKGEDYANPSAILLELEQIPHEKRTMLMTIPSSANADNTDRVVIYCAETGEVYAEAILK